MRDRERETEREEERTGERTIDQSEDRVGARRREGAKKSACDTKNGKGASTVRSADKI